jgi:peptide methionine sulfoxide reductase MsrB
MSQVKCPKCGAEIVPYAVGFPHEKVFVKFCINCVKLKLSNQTKAQAF